MITVPATSFVHERLPGDAPLSFERAYLADLGGGCQVPVGAYGRFEGEDGTLTLTGMVCDLPGEMLLRETMSY